MLPAKEKLLIGVIHLPALPGAPKYLGNWREIISSAERDALTLAQCGFDAVIVENFGDIPFFRERVPSETVACMSVLVDRVKSVSKLTVGVNILRNDGLSALSVAVAAQADFIRVNILVGSRIADQGIIQSDAAYLQRLRSQLQAHHVSVAADVDVKHSSPLGNLSPEDETIEAVERGLADVIIVSGARTGEPASLEQAASIKKICKKPVWVGSGVKTNTAHQWMQIVDGLIVGSELRSNSQPGGPIDHTRAYALARSL